MKLCPSWAQFFRNCKFIILISEMSVNHAITSFLRTIKLYIVNKPHPKAICELSQVVFFIFGKNLIFIRKTQLREIRDNLIFLVRIYTTKRFV